MPHPENPISPEQLAANRANAAKSTGPRTPEGKARSAQNACKHRFTATTFGVVRLEDLQEVASLKADAMATYQPVNSQEIFAVERIALAQQSILRAERLEVGLFTVCLNECFDPLGEPTVLLNEEIAGNGDIQITRAQNRNFLLAEGFHRMAKRSNSWTLFLRYQAQAERHYRRAVEDFERLKALREELPNEPISEPQAEQTESTCAPDETNPSTPQDPVSAELLSEPMLDVFAGRTPSGGQLSFETVPGPWDPEFAAYDAMCHSHSRRNADPPTPDAPPSPAAPAPVADS